MRPSCNSTRPSRLNLLSSRVTVSREGPRHRPQLLMRQRHRKLQPRRRLSMPHPSPLQQSTRQLSPPQSRKAPAAAHSASPLILQRQRPANAVFMLISRCRSINPRNFARRTDCTSLNSIATALSLCCDPFSNEASPSTSPGPPPAPATISPPPKP